MAPEKRFEGAAVAACRMTREPGVVVGRGAAGEFNHGRAARWLHDGSERKAGTVHRARLDARMRRKV
jgi:hypothetical protein